MSMTDLEVFRMLARDKASTFFSDDEANWFIDTYTDSVLLAAAAALENMAADAAMVAKVYESGVYDTDLRSIPREIRAAAKDLRDRYNDQTNGLASTPYSATYESPIFPWEPYSGTSGD